MGFVKSARGRGRYSARTRGPDRFCNFAVSCPIEDPGHASYALWRLGGVLEIPDHAAFMVSPLHFDFCYVKEN